MLEAAGATGALEELTDILIDCVEDGASVGFLAPLSITAAREFWQSVVAAVTGERRVLFVARDDDGRIVGTVQLVLAQADNQPHRADIAKLLVHRRARRQGMAEALMSAAESHAAAIGRDVLVLDTATDDAARLYERLGWRRVGSIPDYALNPDGSRCATVLFCKQLAQPGK
jgi:ribosomal protein S18 acetylase RimI-like enzyme